MARKPTPTDVPPNDAPVAVYAVLEPLKHDADYYGPAGNTAGWPDQIELTDDQAAPLLAAGLVAALAAPPKE